MKGDLRTIVRAFVLSLLAVIIVMAAWALVTGCVPATPRPNYEATIAVAQHEMSECIGELNSAQMSEAECWSQPTQTPNVVVITPIAPSPFPPPATPPYPSNLVACDEAPLGTRVYVTTRTTVRYWHSEASNNLGQAAAGESGVLIDKSKDADALWWWRADGLVTNDHPYGTKGWVKAIYSGCVPPK